MSFQYSSSLFLKMLTDGASAMVDGSRFQLFITRCENDFALTKATACFLILFCCDPALSKSWVEKTVAYSLSLPSCS